MKKGWLGFLLGGLRFRNGINPLKKKNYQSSHSALYVSRHERVVLAGHGRDDEGRARV